MTTKEYLRRADLIDARIKSKRDTLQRLKESAHRITVTMTQSKSSGNGENSKLEECMTRYIDLENEIKRDIAELCNVKSEINGIIRQVNDSRLQLLLEQRYVLGKSWVAVSIAMGVSEDHARGYMHGQALRSVNNVIYAAIKNKFSS